MFQILFFYDALIKMASSKNKKIDGKNHWWWLGTINIVLAPQNRRFYIEIESFYPLAHLYRWKEDNIWQNI
jgi:hypothetical protein